MPDALRRDRGDEHVPAVGEVGGRVGPINLDHELTGEFAIDVGRAELAGRPEPLGVEDTAPDELTGLDVEDVGKIRRDLDLDGEPDRAPSVVDDVVILVNPAGHGPVQADRQAVALDRSLVVNEARVRELEPRGEELDRGRVEQDRLLLVDPHAIARDEPGVPGEESFLRPGPDRAIRRAHDEAVVAIDRHAGGADRDGQAHPGRIGEPGRSNRPSCRHRSAPSAESSNLSRD